MEKILRFDRRHGQRKEHPALRVLVVDDERDTALSLARLLELYGFEAYPVFDGPQALRILQAHPPEVVLLDIRMPGMDGWELAEQIWEQKSAKTPFLIAITGYGTMADQLRSRKSGIDLHLVKPVDPEVLRKILARFQTVIMSDADCVPWANAAATLAPSLGESTESHAAHWDASLGDYHPNL